MYRVPQSLACNMIVARVFPLLQTFRKNQIDIEVRYPELRYLTSIANSGLLPPPFFFYGGGGAFNALWLLTAHHSY